MVSMQVTDPENGRPVITAPEGLAARFTQPDNFQYFGMQSARGLLRVGVAAPAFQPRGVVVVLPGLSEFIEKYFELTRELLQQNYAVVILDWAGQGFSPRHFPNLPQRRHITSLEPDADDLTALLRTDLVTQFKAPVHVLAHSMGGLIYLTAATRKAPLPISSATLTAPLLGLPQFGGLKGLFNRPLLSLLHLVMPNAYVPGGHDWHGREREPAGQGAFSSDPARDSLHNQWYRANPALVTGSPTIGWLSAILQATERLHDPDNLRLLLTPTLILQATQDIIVDNSAARFLNDNPMIKLEQVTGARHEILQERDDMRNQAINARLAWIDRSARLQVMSAYESLEAAQGGGCGCSGCGCKPQPV